MKICPFIGIEFKDVPGYIDAYGCPLCRGLKYHIELARGDAVVARKQTLYAALERVMFEQTDIDEKIAAVLSRDLMLALGERSKLIRSDVCPECGRPDLGCSGQPQGCALPI